MNFLAANRGVWAPNSMKTAAARTKIQTIMGTWSAGTRNHSPVET
jgi:hypothetical protein